MNEENKSLDGMSSGVPPKGESSKPLSITVNDGSEPNPVEPVTASSNDEAPVQPEQIIKPDETSGGPSTDMATSSDNDAKQPTAEEKKLEQPKKKKSKAPLIGLLVLVFVAGAAVATYFFRQSEVDRLQNEISSLKSENASLKTELQALKDGQASEEPETEAPTTPAEPVDVEKAILTAVNSGNYAELQPLMANSVQVVFGASGGGGVRTPAQAVSDMKFLDAGTDPWNFAIPPATLQNYRTGDYASSFPLTASVGQSANDYVVSFQFNSSGKIAAVFMIADADLLTN